MGPIRMVNKFLLLLLVLQALGYIQSATAGLIVFDSKPAFLAATPIETTQDFESFASPTLFAVPQVAFDQVVFSATPTPSDLALVSRTADLCSGEAAFEHCG